MSYADAGASVRDLADRIRPQVRESVSATATKYLRVKSSGGGVVNWDSTATPYMVEPMDLLSSRHYSSVIFIGPARTGKTLALVDGFFVYMVKSDPSDMQIVQITEKAAGLYSRTRVDRALRYTPELKKRLSTRKTDDSVFTKWLNTGEVLKLSWPSISELSGRDMKYMVLTDYDRMPLDVGGEGSIFKQASKRTQTFMSRGMTLVESSPGYEVQDPNWKPSTPHEAPPTKGILALYNSGDRRRMYWRCPHCGDYYMIPAGIEGFQFKHGVDLFGLTDAQIIGDVKAICMANGCEIEEHHKQKMNMGAIWVPDGCSILRDGETYSLEGAPPKTRRASFWMHGLAAGYQRWESIVQEYLNALRIYEITGDEEPLSATVRLDQGAAYLPRRLAEADDRDGIQQRAEKVKKYHVPEGVRTLVATVDVQGGKNARFEVQVHGAGVNNEKWIIDRYAITETAAGEPINPARYIEHWDEITQRVVLSTYKLASGKEMRVFKTAIDTGGEDGVQDRAYDWYRSLKNYGLHDRLMLVKGKGADARTAKGAPKVKISYPDSSKRNDRNSNSRGDVPVYMLNTDKLKDALANDLVRDIPGPGYIHFPDWLQDWFYAELKAERRNEDGRWEKVSQRNEALDLLAYFYAFLFGVKYESIDWNNPPLWAAEWDNNSEVITREERIALKNMDLKYNNSRTRKMRSRGI